VTDFGNSGSSSVGQGCYGKEVLVLQPCSSGDLCPIIVRNLQVDYMFPLI